jgi:hypothetical protein
MADLVATSGSASANSFITVEDADTYMELRLNSDAWTGDDDKAKALVEATREISVMEFYGERTDTTQALSFPREFLPNPDSPNADYYTNTEIPQRVKDATCELALEFLKAGTTDLGSADSNRGVIEKTVGPLTTRWESSQARVTGLSRYPRVLKLLAPFEM